MIHEEGAHGGGVEGWVHHESGVDYNIAGKSKTERSGGTDISMLHHLINIKGKC